MARRYKYYRKRSASPFEGLPFLAGLFTIFGLWQLQRTDSSAFLYACVAVFFVLIIIISLVIRQYRQNQRRIHALDIAAIDTMDPLEFEVYVGKLFKHQGFTDILLTEKYDLGVDIVAKKDGFIWGIQVKRYNGLVKAEAVRQVVTALIRYKCNRAMVVTNSTFSRPARELAADNNCILIDRDELVEWIVEFQNSN